MESCILLICSLLSPTALTNLLVDPVQPNTVPAFPVETQAQSYRLDLSDEPSGGINEACGRNLDRSRCYPVLAAWLFAAHARSAPQLPAPAPTPESSVPDEPMKPDNSQNSLSCPTAFNVSSGFRNATPTAAVKNLEQECRNSSYSGCTRCLGALQKLKGKGGNKKTTTGSFRRSIKNRSPFFSVSRNEDLFISEDSGNPKGSSFCKTGLDLGSLLRSIGSRIFSSSTRRTVIALASLEVSSSGDLYTLSLQLLPESPGAHRLSVHSGVALCLFAFTSPVSSVATSSSRSTDGHVVLPPEVRVEIVPVFLIGELFVAGNHCRDGPVTDCLGDTAISGRHRLDPMKNQLGQISRFGLQVDLAWESFGPLSFWGLTCHDFDFGWAWSISFLVVMGSSPDAHLVLLGLLYVDLAHYLNSDNLKLFKTLHSFYMKRQLSSFSS